MRRNSLPFNTVIDSMGRVKCKNIHIKKTDNCIKYWTFLDFKLLLYMWLYLSPNRLRIEMPFRADILMLTLKKRLFWNSVANGLLAETTTARKGEQMIQLTFWAPRQLYVKLMFMRQGEWMPIYRNGNKSASHSETFSNFQLSPSSTWVSRAVLTAWHGTAGLFCCRVEFVQLFV